MDILQSSRLVYLRQLWKLLVKGEGLFLSPVPQAVIFLVSRVLEGKDGERDESRSDTVVDSSRDKNSKSFETVSEQTPFAESTNAIQDLDPSDPHNVPDLEIMPMPYNASNWTFKELKSKEKGAFSFMVMLLKPRSKGTLRLEKRENFAQDHDARARPLCDLGTLQHPDDIKTMRTGIKFALRLARVMRSPKSDSLDDSKDGYPLEALHVPKSESDEDLDAFIREGARTTYHYCCTCRMGPEAKVTSQSEDEDGRGGGVVDEELRVHGVRGLRVADASVFPEILATHLQAPAVMVAERCAGFILKDNGGRK